MEIFAGAMQELVDEINAAEDERKVAIRLISEEVCSFRNDVNRFMKGVQDFVHDLQIQNIERAEATRELLSSDAKATRELLSSDEKARVEAARQFMDDTRSRLNDFFDISRIKRELAEQGREEATGRYMGNLRSDLDDFFEQCHRKIDEIRSELAKGHRVWAERNSNGNGKTALKASQAVKELSGKENRKPKKKKK